MEVLLHFSINLPSFVIGHLTSGNEQFQNYVDLFNIQFPQLYIGINLSPLSLSHTDADS